MLDVAYLDSSAIVKTIIDEPESAALQAFVSGYRTRAAAELARAEVVRAVRRAEPEALSRAYDALDRLLLVRVGRSLLEGAGLLDPPELRTLDAVHLMAARSLSARLGALVTYDARMESAASALGIPVAVPR